MTLGISTSSPIVAVALWTGDEILGSSCEPAAGAAGRALAVLAAGLLSTNSLAWSDVDEILVDLGPGGFTGVKVGVTFAKTLCWALGCRLSTATAFDLIDPDRSVAIPFRRGEWYLRVPGCQPTQVVGDKPADALGYEDRYPDPANVVRMGSPVTAGDAVMTVPLYVAAPSISKPKNARVLPGAGP